MHAQLAQLVAPATPRGEEFFDAGAKYHVPANTPYTRYFLARILQFQFYKAACDIAKWKGPLHRCSIYGNKKAGAKLHALDIRTIGELAACQRDWLVERFGRSYGAWLHELHHDRKKDAPSGTALALIFSILSVEAKQIHA